MSVPEGVGPKAGSGAAAAELPYVKMLNRVLPPDIRALAWSPAPAGFSARFDCQSRTYRYYFPRGNLDVELMAEAAKRYGKPTSESTRSPGVFAYTLTCADTKARTTSGTCVRWTSGTESCSSRGLSRALACSRASPVTPPPPTLSAFTCSRSKVSPSCTTRSARYFSRVQASSRWLFFLFRLSDWWLFLWAGSVHDGCAASDWPEAGSTRDHQSAIRRREPPQEAPVQVRQRTVSVVSSALVILTAQRDASGDQ